MSKIKAIEIATSENIYNDFIRVVGEENPEWSIHRKPNGPDGKYWVPPYPKDIWDSWINSVSYLPEISLPSNYTLSSGGYPLQPYAKGEHVLPSHYQRLWDFVHNQSQFQTQSDSSTSRRVSFPIWSKRGVISPSFVEYPLIPPFLPDIRPLAKNTAYPNSLWEYTIPRNPNKLQYLTGSFRMRTKVVFTRAHGKIKKETDSWAFEFTPHEAKINQPVQPDYREALKRPNTVSVLPYGDVILRNLKPFTHNGWYSLHSQALARNPSFPEFKSKVHRKVLIQVRKAMEERHMDIETAVDYIYSSKKDMGIPKEELLDLVSQSFQLAAYLPKFNSDRTPVFEEKPTITYLLQVVHNKPPLRPIRHVFSNVAIKYSVPPFLSQVDIGEVDFIQNATQIQWSVEVPRNIFGQITWEPSTNYLVSVTTERPGVYIILCSVTYPFGMRKRETLLPGVTLYSFELVKTQVDILPVSPNDSFSPLSMLNYPPALNENLELFGHAPLDTNYPFLAQKRDNKGEEWKFIQFICPKLHQISNYESVLQIIRQNWVAIQTGKDNQTIRDAQPVSEVTLDKQWIILAQHQTVEEYYKLIYVFIEYQRIFVSQFGQTVDLKSHLSPDLQVWWYHDYPVEPVKRLGRGTHITFNVVLPRNLGRYFAEVFEKGSSKVYYTLEYYVELTFPLVTNRLASATWKQPFAELPKFTRSYCQRFFRDHHINVMDYKDRFPYVIEYLRLMEVFIERYSSVCYVTNQFPKGYESLAPTYMHAPFVRLKLASPVPNFKGRLRAYYFVLDPVRANFINVLSPTLDDPAAQLPEILRREELSDSKELLDVISDVYAHISHYVRTKADDDNPLYQVDIMLKNFNALLELYKKRFDVRMTQFRRDQDMLLESDRKKKKEEQYYFLVKKLWKLKSQGAFFRRSAHQLYNAIQSYDEIVRPLQSLYFLLEENPIQEHIIEVASFFVASVCKCRKEGMLWIETGPELNLTQRAIIIDEMNYEGFINAEKYTLISLIRYYLSQNTYSQKALDLMASKPISSVDAFISSLNEYYDTNAFGRKFLQIMEETRFDYEQIIRKEVEGSVSSFSLMKEENPFQTIRYELTSGQYESLATAIRTQIAIIYTPTGSQSPIDIFKKAVEFYIVTRYANIKQRQAMVAENLAFLQEISREDSPYSAALKWQTMLLRDIDIKELETFVRKFREDFLFNKAPFWRCWPFLRASISNICQSLIRENKDQSFWELTLYSPEIFLLATLYWQREAQIPQSFTTTSLNFYRPNIIAQIIFKFIYETTYDLFGVEEK